MAITKVYTRINWEDYPSVNTAVSAKNLNNMDYTINKLDDEMVELDSRKAEQSTVLGMVQNWEMDENTGIITVTKLNGTKILFDLNIEKIPVQFSLSENGILTMTVQDGTKYNADIGKMIPVLVFNDSDNVGVNVSGTGSNRTYSFYIKESSVTKAKLHPEVMTEINKAEGNALLSRSYAVGGTGTREVEDTDNARYYKEQAALKAAQANGYASQAGGHASQAGSYATQAADSAAQAAATLSVCTEHINNTSNPHGTDKNDVGLGNVPNVTTNDQTPTFSQASSRTNLVSGEKLSVSLGKIMKWFSDLKSHAFSSPVNNLTSTSSATALAAAQGKALNDKIEAIPTIIFSASEPVTVAANTIVMVYE